MQKTFRVQKKSGDYEEFSYAKLKLSLENSGATKTQVEEVLQDIKPYLKEGLKTSDIYAHAYTLLRRDRSAASYRYKIKKAIMELGPTGFAFEKFISRILTHLGYTTEVGQIKQGLCVQHEVDVIAKKENYTLFAECKYKNNAGTKTDIKTALYVQARSLDLNKNHKFDEYWLITNAKFSEDAIKYAECSGLRLMGWSYPPEHNLMKRLESLSLIPITCLNSLHRDHKNFLISKEILFCQDLKNHPEIFQDLRLPSKLEKMVRDELKIINCG